MRALISGLSLALALSWGGAAGARKKARAEPVAKPAGPEVQGHRGARASRPENTLPAFEFALKAGVDVLELDLAVTADDQLVVSHDLHINTVICEDRGRRSKGPGPAIHRLTLNEVKRWDCGTRRHPRFRLQQPVPGVRMPTLDAVFEMVNQSEAPAAKTVHFNIETKIVPGRPELTPTPETFARLLLASVRKHNMVGRVRVQSFDQRTLKAVEQAAPEIPRVMLFAENYIDFVGAAKAAGAGAVSPHQHWITEADVARLQAAGLKVVPWTANEPSEWRRLVQMKVDGIISDDPAALIRWLEQQGLREKPAP